MIKFKNINSEGIIAIRYGDTNLYLTIVEAKSPTDRSHLELRESNFDTFLPKISREECKAYINRAKQADFSFKECGIDPNKLSFCFFRPICFC